MRGFSTRTSPATAMPTWCEFASPPRCPPTGLPGIPAIGLNRPWEQIWNTIALRLDPHRGADRRRPRPAGHGLAMDLAGQRRLRSYSAADGTPIDRFNYGAQINGLATVEIEGKPVLLARSVRPTAWSRPLRVE